MTVFTNSKIRLACVPPLRIQTNDYVQKHLIKQMTHTHTHNFIMPFSIFWLCGPNISTNDPISMIKNTMTMCARVLWTKLSLNFFISTTDYSVIFGILEFDCVFITNWLNKDNILITASPNPKKTPFRCVYLCIFDDVPWE